MSGLYGSKTGVLEVAAATLDRSSTTILESLNEATGNGYARGVFGKWHLGSRNDGSHPNDQGADHFMGYLAGSPGDYFNWNRVDDGVSSTSAEYLTTEITSDAISWIDQQVQPWMVWMAHGAPHTPFHYPPDSLFTRPQTGDDLSQYLAMIESVDHEVGRLLDSLTSEERENTLVMFIGDNGTPQSVLQGFPSRRGKGTLYQGGLNVPMIVSGAGVSRIGEIDSSLVHVMDIHASILEAVGQDLDGGILNSFSFYDLLKDSAALSRPFLLSEMTTDAGYASAIRNDRYKLIEYASGASEFFDLSADRFEIDNLETAGLSVEHQAIKDELHAEAELQFQGWSCQDGIVNGDETIGSCAMSTFLEQEFFPQEDQPLQAYPNPTAGIVFISISSLLMEMPTEIIVFNMTGQEVKRNAAAFRPAKTRISLVGLPPGSYIIQVRPVESMKGASSTLVAKL